MTEDKEKALFDLAHAAINAVAFAKVALRGLENPEAKAEWQARLDRFETALQLASKDWSEAQS